MHINDVGVSGVNPLNSISGSVNIGATDESGRNVNSISVSHTCTDTRSTAYCLITAEHTSIRGSHGLLWRKNADTWLLLKLSSLINVQSTV